MSVTCLSLDSAHIRVLQLYTEKVEVGLEKKCLATQLGDSLDLFHVLLYGIRCHILCIGAG